MVETCKERFRAKKNAKKSVVGLKALFFQVVRLGLELVSQFTLANPLEVFHSPGFGK